MIRRGLLVVCIYLMLCLPFHSTATGKADVENLSINDQDSERNTLFGKIASLIITDELKAREVKAVFDVLKNRLPAAASMQETWQIFNDTIVSLDQYHLLPTGMSMRQAQQLVRPIRPYQKGVVFPQKLSRKFQGDPNAEGLQNVFCSIAGNTSNTHFAKLAKRIGLRLFVIMDYCTGNALLVKLATGVWIICNQINKISELMLHQDWKHCGVAIYFGNYHYYPYPQWLSPAQGWLSTNGLFGKQNITGSFWGQTMIGGWQPQDDWYMNYTWRGCAGFTGLIIYSGTDTAYYLGSALSVNVGPHRP